MRQPLSLPVENSILLMGIREGMPVYDRISHKLGTVKAVRFPGDILDEIDDIEVQNAPDAVRWRLLNAGFSRINTGLLRKDYYVTVDQIDEVVDDRVYLRVLREALLTL